VPTACNVGRLSGHVRQRACGLPYPTTGRRSCPSVALHVCFLTAAPRRWRPGRCLPFHVPIPPATSTNCPVASDGRGGDSLVIPRPVVRGPDGRCASLVLLPMPSPRPFWVRHRPLCRWSTGGDGVPSSAGNSAGSSR